MKKKVLVLATLVIAMATTVKAQLNVGSTLAPDASSMLQVTSGTKGLRLPQVALTTTTTFGLTAATSVDSAKGMVVYNTAAGITSSNLSYPAAGAGAYTWDGTGWVVASGTKADVRVVGIRNHISSDAGIGSNGTSAGTGGDNIAIGALAISANASGTQNIALGTRSLFSNTNGSNSIAMGTGTLRSNTTGFNNTAIGNQSLALTTSGDHNIAIGDSALYSNVTGGQNIALGQFALKNNIGIGNTAMGLSTLGSNTSGQYNTAIGITSATQNTTGNQNTNVGYQSLYYNTAGNNNTAIGTGALISTTGSTNIGIGFQAGNFSTSGSNNITIGNTVNISSATASNEMNIGNMIHGVFIDGSGTGGNIQIGYNATPLNGYNTLEVKGTTSISGSVVMGTFGCPQNSGTAYQIVSADCQKSIFYLDNIHYMSSLTLPTAAMAAAASTPQPGQMLRIVNLATTAVVVNGANTDNTGTNITLVAAGTAGQHSVEYVWIGTVWMRMQ